MQATEASESKSRAMEIEKEMDQIMEKWMTAHKVTIIEDM